MRKCVVALVGMLSVVANAQDKLASQDKYASSSAELEKLKTEAAEIKSAPVVQWLEFNGKFNPSLNVIKKGNVVKISRVFACPRHKGHAYDESGRCSFVMDLTHRWAHCEETCDAKTRWCEWNQYRMMIEDCAAKQDRLGEIETRIGEIENEIRIQEEQAAAEKKFKPEVNDDGRIVVERDDELLVRIKVGTLLKVLSGDKVINKHLRIYYQNPEDSGDM